MPNGLQIECIKWCHALKVTAFVSQSYIAVQVEVGRASRRKKTVHSVSLHPVLDFVPFQLI